MASITARTTGPSVIISVLLIILGFLAIILPLEAGIAIAVLVGWLIILGGVFYLAHAFAGGRTGSTIWHVIVGIAYIIGGVYVLIHPALGLVTLTLLLSVVFFVEAIIEIVHYFSTRALPGASWGLFNGIITLILAILIWRHWPASSAWAIGTLVGISLMISGFTRLMYGRSARRSLLAI